MKISDWVGHRFNCPRGNGEFEDTSFNPQPLIDLGVEECWFWHGRCVEDSNYIAVLMRRGTQYAIHVDGYGAGQDPFRAYPPAWGSLKSAEKVVGGMRRYWRTDTLIAAARKAA